MATVTHLTSATNETYSAESNRAQTTIISPKTSL